MKDKFNKIFKCKEIDYLYSFILSSRYLNSQLYKYTDKTLYDLSLSESNSDIYYLPVDLIDLRYILKYEKSTNVYQCLVDLELAKRYYLDNIIFLGVEIKKENFEFCGGFAVPLNKNLEIKTDCIKKILTRDNGDSVRYILKDFNLNIELFKLEEVPFLSIPKIASSNSKKFVINIPSLEIKNVHINSDNGVDALDEALFQKWKTIGNGLQRPLKYTAKYWEDSPLWNDIVKLSVESENKMIKNIFKLAQHNLEFTDVEQNIFALLKSVCGFIKEKSGKTIVLRLAGGIVRDKLMGIMSDDIDIAVSSMTGSEFVKYIEEYAKANNLPQNIVGKNYLVEKDTEKAKQLETAGVALYGQKVEFVNLRKEVYDENSRVPRMEITDDPKLDAERRDLSINSIFYNINTGQVEDYVGGIEDLKNMYLRTPLDPTQTFKDDPLRMLRTLRFFSKYPNAKLDPQILKAMSDPSVQALYKKLSPERSSKELKKMFEGDNAPQAMDYLYSTGLYRQVFGIPENHYPIEMDQQNPHHLLNLKDHTIEVMRNLQRIAKENNLPKEKVGLLMAASAFHDLYKADPNIKKEHPKKPGQYQYIGHDSAAAKFIDQMMKKMAFDPKDRDFVVSVIAGHMKPHEFDKNRSNKAVGRFLNESSDYWKDILDHARADSLSKGQVSQEEHSRINKEKDEHLKHISNYKNYMSRYINTPLIDGNKIKEILLENVPEIVNNNVIVNKDGKKVHYMTFIVQRLVEKQWENLVLTPELIEYASTVPSPEKENILNKALTPEKEKDLVISMGKNLLGQWKQENAQKPKKANVFTLTKES